MQIPLIKYTNNFDQTHNFKYEQTIEGFYGFYGFFI
jgi:hypothetical protein